MNNDSDGLIASEELALAEVTSREIAHVAAAPWDLHNCAMDAPGMSRDRKLHAQFSKSRTERGRSEPLRR